MSGNKAFVLTASYDGAVAWNTIERNQRTMVAEPVCVASRGRNPDDPSDRTAGAPTEQRFEAHEDGKTNTLTSVSKDNLIAEPVQVGRMPREDGAVTDSKQYRVYSPDGKSVTLCGNGGGVGAKTGLYACPASMAWRGHAAHGNPSSFEMRKDGKSNAVIVGHQNRLVIDLPDGKTMPVYEVRDGKITVKGKQYPIKLRDGFYIIRKLTVSECKRLQTVPEWYEFPVSNSQAYKMLGNGWTVEVIAHLIRAALSGKVCGEYQQTNLFEQEVKT